MYKFVLLYLSLLGVPSSPSAYETDVNECRYYSYVVYGKAITDGNLDKLEKVYKGFKVYRSKENFFASFSFYKATTSGPLKIVNIGPYYSESVLYQEITRIRNQIENQGHKLADRRRHLFPAVLLDGNKKCN